MPRLRLPRRFRAQMAHLTTPATVWRYVESACTRSGANLVMLDLEDSIPRGDDAALAAGREHVVRALLDLDWGDRLRFFRPRGLELDPRLDDVRFVVERAGPRLEGLVVPKVDGADEVLRVAALLDVLEAEHGLSRGAIRVEVLIESVLAEEHAFEIARATPRLAGLIFGAFDYWSSLGIAEPYRFDHPLIDGARARVAKAAASVGVPAIAEMTLNYPTKDKSESERAAALAECRRDAEHARTLGYRGKWTGIPAQTEIAIDVFSIPAAAIDRALREVRLFGQAEREGRGATIIDGKMADRATDRINRTLLHAALELGAIDDAVAAEIGLETGA